MKLISMTDFVLEQNKFRETFRYKSKQFQTSIINYANFLKQPLELWMFVPCDENGNVLEEPNPDKFTMDNVQSFDIFREQLSYYNKAKERILFEGFDIDASNGLLYYNDVIEHLVGKDISLTPNAIKQI